MPTKRTNKILTLGDLIENCYSACGKHRAEGLLRLALKAQLVATPINGLKIVLNEPEDCG